jgi:outer membrane protein assembly factor BamB
MVVFGAGDGFCYGFDPEPSGDGTLKEIWRCDCNPPQRRVKDGKPLKHSQPMGPSEIISTPVIVNDRVYVSIGHEPEGGDGLGAITCIDATRTGDITSAGRVWQTDIGRSVSTASVAEGLVFIADFAGFLHCLDASTGKELWKHDTEGHIWGSTLLADGRVYLGNESGALFMFAASKEKKLIGQIDMKDPIYSTPIAANGTLIIATSANLYAISGEGK